jgi:asparagine synthase (glutamine-hydrolysing)
MCGIYGGISWGSPLRAGDFARMGEAIRHRGPDDAGFYISDTGAVALGHRRLSIIDLSEKGRQPMWNERNSVGLVFNGEIYNFQTLRTELEQAGHRFRSNTDSEVIIHGYEQYGEGVFDRLDGMFAFALWDGEREEMFMLRDRLGKKPLYMWRGHQSFLFASELKALIAHHHVSRTLNPAAIVDYLTLGYVPSPSTMFTDVQKVRPGESVRVTVSGESTSRFYWRLPALGSHRPHRDEAVATIRSLVTASVQKRLVADVPVGAFLSGGIDSTVVVGLMTRLTGKGPQTFTVGFEAGPSTGKVNEDLRRARNTARHFGTEHSELMIGSGTDFERLLDMTVRHLDEPNANPTVLSTLAVSELARANGVKVVMTGDGGDELFAGYPRYLYDMYVERAARVPRIVRQAGAAVLDVVHTRRAQRATRFLNKTLEMDGALPPARYLQWRRHFQPDEQRQLLPPALAESAASYSAETLLAKHLGAFPGASGQDRLSYADLHLWVADDSNTRVDRTTMALSLEARCPMLDRALVEYAMAIPVRDKIVSGQTKYLLKTAFADLIPAETLHGSKKGFASPVRWWLSSHLASQVDAVLSPDRVRRAGVLDPNGIESLRRSGEWKRVPLKLWALIVLQRWAETFLSEPARP